MSDEIARAMKSPALAQQLERETLIPAFDTPAYLYWSTVMPPTRARDSRIVGAGLSP